MEVVRPFIVGARLHWRQIFGWGFAAWGFCWLAIESLSLLPAFKEWVSIYDTHVLALFVFVTVVFVIFRLRAPTRTSFRIPSTNTTVEILFGDIFNCEGHWAISVNEYFDGQLGEFVSLKSVHGQFIHRYFEGDSTRFEQVVDGLLAGVKSKQKVRKIERTASYPIGTTAVVEVGERKCFLFALTRTDPQTAKSSTDVSMIWAALEKLWKEVRARSNGKSISIPLIASGRASIGLAPAHVLRLMLVSLFVATREQEVTPHVRIVLHESLFDRIDLARIRSEWLT